jgi:hypothetical protein
MHAWPPVFSGTAAAIGLSDNAAPHTPAAAAITLRLNRSKIVINVNSFIRAPADPSGRSGRPA